MEEFGPDLIILDLNMPEMDGLEVLKRLRKQTPREAFLPVLVLTADATGDSKRKALSAGCE